MRFEKSGISGSYDEKYDILYLYYKNRELSYGTEDSEGIVIMKSIDTDQVTGFLIYNFKKRQNLDIGQFDLVFRCVIEELTKELQNGSII